MMALFIAQLPLTTAIGIGVIAGIIVGTIGVILLGKVMGNQVIGTARRQAEQILKDAEADAALLKSVTQHWFRHMLASRMLREGDVVSVGEMDLVLLLR